MLCGPRGFRPFDETAFRRRPPLRPPPFAARAPRPAKKRPVRGALGPRRSGRRGECRVRGSRQRFMESLGPVCEQRLNGRGLGRLRRCAWLAARAGLLEVGRDLAGLEAAERHVLGVVGGAVAADGLPAQAFAAQRELDGGRAAEAARQAELRRAAPDRRGSRSPRPREYRATMPHVARRRCRPVYCAVDCELRYLLKPSPVRGGQLRRVLRVVAYSTARKPTAGRVCSGAVCAAGVRLSEQEESRGKPFISRPGGGVHRSGAFLFAASPPPLRPLAGRSGLDAELLQAYWSVRSGPSSLAAFVML